MSLTIDWGDGTIEPGAIIWQSSAGKVTSTHRYLDNGNYLGTLHVFGAQATESQDALRFAVASIAPVVTLGGDVNLTAGQMLARSGSFLDPGADTWTATVDYGTVAGFVPLALNTDKSFALNHAYSTTGSYTVKVRVMDDDGVRQTQQFKVTVGPEPDTTPPRVISFKTTKKQGALATMVVGFSEAMGPRVVMSLGSYRLVSAGRDEKFGTKDDKTLVLGKMLYDQARRIATLTSKKRVALNQPLRLIVRGSAAIADLALNGLDGDSDGGTGGDFIGQFGTKPRSR